ncbi:MAG: hypothetical protein OXI81_04805 [Paracoccaceae bacterium]|nr:hypothetical protein [Paracoccaceae bacterium]
MVAVASGGFNLDVTDTAVAGIAGLAKQDTSVAALGDWMGADDMNSTGSGDA